MSYARKGPDSDVYVFSDGERYLCAMCSLDEVGGTRVCAMAGEMLSHLVEHIKAKHKVPRDCMTRLIEEKP